MIPLLALLAANADAALLTLTAGILLIYFECNRPGYVLPGCLGALLLLLSLDAFAHMPLRLPALALCAAGIVLVLAELLLPARNAIAAAGTVALIVGLKTAIPPPSQAQPFSPSTVHTLVAVITGTIFAVTTLWLARIALRARRNKRTLASAPAYADTIIRYRSPAPHRVD